MKGEATPTGAAQLTLTGSSAHGSRRAELGREDPNEGSRRAEAGREGRISRGTRMAYLPYQARNARNATRHQRDEVELCQRDKGTPHWRRQMGWDGIMLGRFHEIRV